MSSQASKASKKIASQRISTVVQVLSIMSAEAEQMSWFQRFKISQSFLWKKNIASFFEIANKNRKEEKHAKVQVTETK